MTPSIRAGSSSAAGTRYGMAAARIFAFARTSRCAIVVVGMRKARAISSVLSPQSVRSVSATCASIASDGWQQVKIRRSRSSGTPSSSTISTSARSLAASSACFSANRARRRMRSMALCRAAV